PGAVQGRSGGGVVEPRVLVRNQHGDRRADGPSHSDTAEELDVVGFDLLPPAATVPALPAAKLAVDEILVHRHACRHAFHQRQQRPPVRLPGGSIAQQTHSRTILAEPARSVRATAGRFTRGARSVPGTERARLLPSRGPFEKRGSAGASPSLNPVTCPES